MPSYLSPGEPDVIDRAKAAVTERAELPGMSLFEHLDELRKRLIHSALYLVAGYLVAVFFAPRLYELVQEPLNRIHVQLNFTHPADLVNLRYIQIPLVGGAILAAPFILFQVWLFIAPGLYQRERRFLVPFMIAAIGLFFSGAYLGYHFVFPGMLKFLITDLSKQMGINPIISIEEYTSFFLSLILGMGAVFEMPVVIFFLALFGIVSPRFLWKNLRYAILIIFIIAAIITPYSGYPHVVCFCDADAGVIPDWDWGGVVGTSGAEEEERGCGLRGGLERLSRPTSRGRDVRRPLLFLLILLFPVAGFGQQHFRGDKALEITQQFVAIGPRWVGSPGHAKAEAFLRDQFKKDKLEEDAFTADTPIGPVPMRNFIVRFPGKKPGVIVLATHYETNYPLRNIGFVGANDGGSTTGLLIEIANEIRGRVQDGYSVWLVFFDGEEAIEKWEGDDNTYGSRHLGAKWGMDNTLPKIKAFLLADMLGDKDLNVQRETQSTTWLADLVAQAARNTGHSKYFFAKELAEDDDHLAFVGRGVPSLDVIDSDYGPHTAALPDGYHHTAQDTMDKISAKSLTIVGDVFLESIRLINLRK